ncbi:MAG TPA: hypothetical protein VJB70_02365 [Candidatus Paceibacterota bacterium]|uniref:Uncharacterized protein n=1 Tax=Candidatus Zambryskibacteria bacterium RIFCSPHIGHO2_01_FULL_49_18 TaxID=1802740 RepID=A0A1G2T419_9BACT|nr:MAG: hypothetical protein UY36_C0014G0002 [Parcubacteria group bacterium GW2011_GWA1_49_11]OHA91882.1 MAG: hypothetical protein A2758_01240 [Candidatus Zambryskibacteria bacterium RIFCSPHIGHO2_01_FULL_49_18]
MDKDEFENWMAALEGSSGHKKVINYIRALADTKEFKDFITRMREKYEIPAGGLKDEQQTVPPPEWVQKHSYDEYRKLASEASKFAQTYHLHHLDGEETIVHYIFYDELVFYSNHNAFNLCIVSDIPMEKDEPFSKITQEDDDRLFPIAIRVSPYATLRDILDFVKRVYKHEIVFLQNNYKEKGVRLGKFKERKGKIRERNDFIYSHRDLPRKQIVPLVHERFGKDNILDVGHIGKIISLEKKRRKEL